MNAASTPSAMFRNIVMTCFIAAVAITMVEFAPSAGGQAVSAQVIAAQSAYTSGSTTVPDASTVLSGVAESTDAPAPTF